MSMRRDTYNATMGSRTGSLLDESRSRQTNGAERLDAAPPIAMTEGVALSVTPLLPKVASDVGRVIPNLVSLST